VKDSNPEAMVAWVVVGFAIAFIVASTVVTAHFVVKFW
jgi:hypothetical protein